MNPVNPVKPPPIEIHEDLPFAEPSAEWITANEANWSNVYDEDAEHLIGPRPPVHACAWCGGRLHHSEACEELRDSWAPKLTFGKHKGQRVDEVDLEYLRWTWDKGVIRNADLKKAIRKLLGIKETPVASHETEVEAAVW